jgi:hypothetical protein
LGHEKAPGKRAGQKSYFFRLQRSRIIMTAMAMMPAAMNDRPNISRPMKMGFIGFPLGLLFSPVFPGGPEKDDQKDSQ